MKQITWLATTIFVAMVFAGCANLELSDSVEALSKRVAKVEKHVGLTDSKPKKDTKKDETKAHFQVAVTQCVNGDANVILLNPVKARKDQPGLEKVKSVKLTNGTLQFLGGDGKPIAVGITTMNNCKVGTVLGMKMLDPK